MGKWEEQQRYYGMKHCNAWSGVEPETEMPHPGLSRSCCRTGRGWAEPRRTGTHRRLYEPEKHVTSSFVPSGLFVNCANVCLCKSLSELSSSSSQEMVAPYPLNTSHLLRRHLKLKFENWDRSFKSFISCTDTPRDSLEVMISFVHLWIVKAKGIDMWIKGGPSWVRNVFFFIFAVVILFNWHFSIVC